MNANILLRGLAADGRDLHAGVEAEQRHARVEVAAQHVGLLLPRAGAGAGPARAVDVQAEQRRARPAAGGTPGPHPIQGVGANFVPENLHTAVLDGVVLIEAEEAREWARRSARVEGVLVGLSSGGTLAAISKKLPELPRGATVLGFNYDTGERYLSVPDFLPA